MSAEEDRCMHLNAPVTDGEIISIQEVWLKGQMVSFVFFHGTPQLCAVPLQDVFAAVETNDDGTESVLVHFPDTEMFVSGTFLQYIRVLLSENNRIIPGLSDYQPWVCMYTKDGVRKAWTKTTHDIVNWLMRRGIAIPGRLDGVMREHTFLEGVKKVMEDDGAEDVMVKKSV